MMHDRGKSDSAIVAAKPTNNAGQPAAEPRAGTKRNAGEAKHTPDTALGSCDPGARSRREEDRNVDGQHHVRRQRCR
jgi:hypothetical protein